MSTQQPPKRTRVPASGRTEPLFIRVRPELKVYVEQRVLERGGNNAEFLEYLIEQDMESRAKSIRT